MLQKEAYIKSMSVNSWIEYKICNRYPGDDGCGVKIIVRKVIWKNEIIYELYGRLAPINDDFFIKYGIKDFSEVISLTTKKSKLWLGPASFVNHDCESNTDLFSLGPDSAVVRANRKINKGEEITIYYGSSYFGLDNSKYMCVSCEKKLIGHFKPQIVRPVQTETNSVSIQKKGEEFFFMCDVWLIFFVQKLAKRAYY